MNRHIELRGRRAPTRGVAWTCYLAASMVIATGISLAARAFPGSYDWPYTVISALASRKHNPDGAAWLGGAIVCAMALLWPVVGRVTDAASHQHAAPRWISWLLRAALVAGFLVGVDRLVFDHFSNILRKGHELLALLAFVGAYGGILGICWQLVRSVRAASFTTALVVSPLLAIGGAQLALYLTQRHLGWVDPGWRALGVPVWLSFAFWQWVAVAALWLSIGHLLHMAGKFERC